MKKHIYDFVKDILEQASVGTFIMTIVGGVALVWVKVLDFLQEQDWHDGYGWIGILLFSIYLILFFISLLRMLSKWRS